MSDMIERVARAICIADGENPDRPFTSGDVTMPCWKSYTSRAVAAIEEMRKPTEDMIEAGFRARSPKMSMGDSAKATYVAMIGAALVA